MPDPALKDESTKLIKYFLASITTPEKDLWVNLSPYEKDRITPESFGQTEMGRDLLAQDYMLKQLTASLIYPEDELGKKFWNRVYEESAKRFGTTNIPVNSFNKVWIVPEKAEVYENAPAGTAYVLESRLKVMLEEDYLALEKNDQTIPQRATHTSGLGSQIVREIVIPQLIKEVNEGQNFAQLRQVYNSLILATWYKKKVKDSILSKVYADKNKVTGVNIDDPQEKQKIYAQYLQAFKMGVYNFIKEETDPITQQTTPRKYFSGGVSTHLISAVFNIRDSGNFSISDINSETIMRVGANAAMISSRPLRMLIFESMGKAKSLNDLGVNLLTRYQKCVDLWGEQFIDKILNEETESNMQQFRRFTHINFSSATRGEDFVWRIKEVFRVNTPAAAESSKKNLTRIIKYPDEVATWAEKVLLDTNPSDRIAERFIDVLISARDILGDEILTEAGYLYLLMRMADVFGINRNPNSEFNANGQIGREYLRSFPEKERSIFVFSLAYILGRNFMFSMGIAGGKEVDSGISEAFSELFAQAIYQGLGANRELEEVRKIRNPTGGLVGESGIDMLWSAALGDDHLKALEHAINILKNHKNDYKLTNQMMPVRQFIQKLKDEVTGETVLPGDQGIFLDLLLDSTQDQLTYELQDFDTLVAFYSDYGSAEKINLSHAKLTSLLDQKVRPWGYQSFENFFKEKKRIKSPATDVKQPRTELVIKTREGEELNVMILNRRDDSIAADITDENGVLTPIVRKYLVPAFAEPTARATTLLHKSLGIHRVEIGNKYQVLIRYYKQQRVLAIIGYLSERDVHASKDTHAFGDRANKLIKSWAKTGEEGKKEFDPRRFGKIYVKPDDKAMLEIENTGGIDLTSDKVFKVTKDAQGQIKFTFDPAMLEQLQNAAGLMPVVTLMEPMQDLRLFLGFKG